MCVVRLNILFIDAYLIRVCVCTHEHTLYSPYTPIYSVRSDHFTDMLEVSRFSPTLNVYRESALKPVMVAVNSRVIAG